VKRIVVSVLAVALAAAGCGDDDGDEQTAAPPETTTQAAPPATTEAERKPERPDGTEVVLRDSEFGPMLFDSKRQAIYIFERDSKNRTNCYDDCAEAWPPVYTDGEPRAGDGVKQSLLGTVKRRDGRLQVTYAGQPLYFYAHEAPGEVRCHNVDLNGGLWWVVGADGKRRP
jgi:predicted lipoprotein with Yx(FWY)xxD motif